MTQKLTIPGDYQYQALNTGHTPQRFWHANKLELLNILDNFSPKDSVLDAGCGSGNIAFFLAHKVKKVIGLDLSQSAIDFAQQKVIETRVKNLSFQTADLRHLPFRDNSFTRVILFEVVEHLNLKDYQQILSEIYRVLKPDGKLYLTTPNQLSLWPLIEWFLDTFRLVPPLKNQQHILELTLPLVTQTLIRCGFKIEKTGTMNHLSPLFSIFSWKLAQQVFYFEIKYLKKFGPILWLVARKS
ncbi:MAG: class I SAM-dependent methyltransferase [Candidatus Shapirobacteria bacterium]